MKTKLRTILCALALLFTSSSFTQTQLGIDIDGEAVNDQSGSSVSLSSDGSIVAIGAFGNDGNGGASGHTRIYSYDGTSWSQLGTDIYGEAGDTSGFSVSLSSDGSIVAIGSVLNDGNGTNSGNVRIYNYDGTSWSQIGQDIYGEAASDQSGASVSISSNGSRVAISARYNAGNGTESGHVRIYSYNGTSWSQTGQDIDGEAANDLSGNSVSLSSNGSIVAIGANRNDGNGTDSGHARIYGYNGTSWSQLGADIDGESLGDESGISVSLNSDGSRVAVGAQRDDGNGQDSGHVRIYSYDGASWSQIGQDIDGEAALNFSGVSVNLNSDGNRVGIGAQGNDVNGSFTGHVRVYNYDGTSWSQLGVDIDGEAAGDQYGRSVSLSSDGNIVAIGAKFNDGNGSNSGHVRVYDLSTLLSTSDLTIAPIYIGPNPIEDELLVHLKDGSRIKAVKLYDITGKLVLNTTLSVIATSHLASGIYIINITTDKGSYIRKLIKK